MFPAFNPTVKQSRVALELTRPVGHWVEGPCIHESVSKSKFTEEFHGNGPILQKNKKKRHETSYMQIIAVLTILSTTSEPSRKWKHISKVVE